jgi:DNA-binding MarR family transcriptional regulator
VKGALPPSYVNTPVTIAYAKADDALIVTMTRILGLCWAYDYERTSALTPEQLADLTGRPRSTLYRHLKHLREMRWIRVDQAGRRIVIRPITTHSVHATDREAARAGGPGGEPGEEPAGAPVLNEALLQALADIGIENPKRRQLAGLDIDPLWVQAWQLWAQHPHRRTLTNPVGNIIRKLEGGERPPREFLRAAEEEIRLRHWTQEQADKDEDLEDQDKLEPEAAVRAPEEDDLSEARRIWARSLEELKLQMTKAAFDTWLRGSQVVEAGDGCLTVAVRHIHAVDWLQNRLLPVIERTVARHADGEIKITFVACA